MDVKANKSLNAKEEICFEQTSCVFKPVISD